MTPHAFVHKWAAGSPAHQLKERAEAQAHFIDLCRVLGVPEPADPDAHCFERGITKTGSAAQRTDGFADVCGCAGTSPVSTRPPARAWGRRWSS